MVKVGNKESTSILKVNSYRIPTVKLTPAISFD